MDLANQQRGTPPDRRTVRNRAAVFPLNEPQRGTEYRPGRIPRPEPYQQLPWRPQLHSPFMSMAPRTHLKRRGKNCFVSMSKDRLSRYTIEICRFHQETNFIVLKSSHPMSSP